MATVYLARDPRHERRVALKVLNPELGAMLGVERFLSEIRVTANLQHPNLVPLFDSGEAGGLLFYVMPFIEGESLRARLDRERQLPVDEAIRIAASVAGALEYAHTRGVVHRDLKPENILLQAGQPVVADFGIALAVSNAGGARLTQTGLSLGTPQYMSPEQAAGDRAIDGRSDVYSLAAVTYEMLTGEPPHAGATLQSTLAKVLNDPPPSVRGLRPAVSQATDAALQRALAKVPADRFAGAHDFATALTSSDPNSHATARPTARAGWRRTILWAAPVATAIAAGAITLAMARPESKPSIVIRMPFNPDPAMRVVTSLVGSSFAQSPDGSHIAFVGADDKGVSRLYVRRLDELAAHSVIGSEQADAPAFSPDGAWLAFHSGGQIKRVLVDGGAAIPITDAPSVYGASWATNDTLVFSDGLRLFAVATAGGKPRPVVRVDSAAGEIGQRWPLVLADGRTIVYTSWPTQGVEGAQLAIVSLDGTNRRLLRLAGTFPLGVVDGWLAYANTAGGLMTAPFDERRARATGAGNVAVRDIEVGPLGGTKIAVSRSGSLVYAGDVGLRELHFVDAHGGSRLLIPTASLGMPRVSPDGKRIAIAITVHEIRGEHVWIYDVQSGTLQRLTFEGTSNVDPEWTSDSRRVGFVSNRSGRPEWWSQPADGSAPATRLVSNGPEVNEGVFAPDGSVVFSSRDSTGKYQLWHASATGEVQRLSTSASSEEAARISPDGHWMAYVSNESGVNQVYVRPFPGVGPRVQISTDGGWSPVWDPRGRRVYYAVNRALVAVDLSADGTPAVTSRRVLFESDFWLESSFTVHANFDVANDGEHFAMLKPAVNPAPVYVHNWRDELAAMARVSRR
jgi:eukaryotic-like serine/threonine-protein kinase